MKRIILVSSSIILMSVPAFSAPRSTPTTTQTPSVTLTGPELDEIYRDLTTPQLFQKQASGALQPVIDPGVQQAIRVLSAKVKQVLDEAAKAKADKAKAANPAAKPDVTPPAKKADKPLPQKAPRQLKHEEHNR